jgi:beta-glucosidase
MPQGTYQFPTGFLWGTATSSYQVEGGNTNSNWSAWEETPGRIVDNQRSGKACDWWGGRWKEDFDRAVETGQNAHRLSIEWSRIQPTPDRWDEDALDHYRQIVRGLVERKMTPLVTLHHFTEPLWITEMGGWENEETPRRFVDYVSRVVEALKEYVSLWITINEPNTYITCGYFECKFPPCKKDLHLAGRVMANMVRGHAGAYRAIHRIQPQAQVGVAQYYRNFVPEKPNFPPDRWAAAALNSMFNNSFLSALVDGRFRFPTASARIPEAAHTQDFFGLNYYTTDIVSFAPFSPGSLFSHRYYPSEAELSTNGFLANIPEGIYDGLNWARRFGLPVFVTENGVEDSADCLRPRYLVEHLHQIWRGINFNWPVKGYFHWTLVDNFEWERGWTQRFGLWGLDVETQARIRRPSVDLYSAICNENAISSDTVMKYAPQSMEKLFPG